MTTQTFSYIGFAIGNNGATKLHWTNNLKRGDYLFKQREFKEFVFTDLPQPMTKLDALEFAKDHPLFQKLEVQVAIEKAREYQIKTTAKSNGTYVMKKRGRPRKNVITTDMIIKIVQEEV
jgi:hypothetical protein